MPSDTPKSPKQDPAKPPPPPKSTTASIPEAEAVAAAVAAPVASPNIASIPALVSHLKIGSPVISPKTPSRLHSIAKLVPPAPPVARRRVSYIFMTVAVLILATAVFSLVARGGLRNTRDIVLTVKNVSYLLGFGRRYQMQYETEPPGTETQLVSPLDSGHGKETLFIQRTNKIDVINPLHYKLHTSIEVVKNDLYEKKENVDVHFKLEANISFPTKLIEYERQYGSITVAVIFNLLPDPLTFLYNYLDCSDAAQPIRVLPSPSNADLTKFQRDLVDNPEQGEKIDHFRCTSSLTSGIYFAETEISTIRILADVNFDTKEFILYTCAMTNRFCTQTYRSILPIDVDKIDINDLQVTFLFARYNGTAGLPEALHPPIKATTWVEIVHP